MNELNQSEIIITSEKNDQSQQSSQSYEMNVDCWEKVFNYLSLRDILAMSETCKRMRQIGGYYFHEHFPDVQCKWIDSQGIYVGYPRAVKRSDFSQFIGKIIISGHLKHHLNAESYCSLKTIILRGNDLDETQIEHMKGVLNAIECVDLQHCTIYGDLFERFLNHCPNLKRLNMDELYIEPNDATNGMFLQKYPSLEHFEYTKMKITPENDQLKIFLEQNSNIKHFGIDIHSLWLNRDSLIGSNVHLNSFVVTISISNDSIPPPTECAELLITLHNCGFYKTLHLCMLDTDEEFDYQALINEMAKLSALEALTFNQDVDLSPLIHLKELCIWGFYTTTSMHILATNLTQLERLFLKKATTDQILPFMHHSKRLTTIKVSEFIDGNLLRNNVLDLLAFNKEREMLGNSRKVSLYTEESVYLATNWNDKNQGLSLVEIAREELEALGEFARCYYF